MEIVKSILSLGYERRTLEELVKILKDHGVQKLIDVRIAPVSRNKVFCKRNLSSRLEESGIKYQHLRETGNPYYKESGDPKHILELYASYLDDNPAIIDRFAEELNEVSSAVLCYERRHKDCHRSILIKVLHKRYPEFHVSRVE